MSSNINLSKTANVLLVDDSEIIIRRMKELLEESPFISTIYTAGTAEEALDKIKSKMPDLMLLDINMPQKNGIEFLQDVKQEFPSIKVIMVSSHSHEFYKELCKDLGAEYFVDKSTEFDSIPNLIENLLSIGWVSEKNLPMN